MKKLAGLAVILAVLILGSYYGMGIITERTLKKSIAMIDQSNGVLVEVDQYHRGLYRSTALLNWRIQVPARTTKNQEGVLVTVPAQEYKMQIPLDISHGPVMFVDSKLKFGLGYARSHIALDQSYADQFAKAYTAESTAPTVNLVLFVNYLNDSTLDVNMPMFKLIAKEGMSQFEWQGMNAETHISSGNKKVKGRVTIDGTIFQKDKASVTLGKVVSDFDLHRTPLRLYLGDANVSISSLVVMHDSRKELDVQAFDAHSTSDIKDGLLSTHVKITLSKLLTADKVYGPAVLDMSLSNLDAETFVKINKQANDLQQGSEADQQKALLMLMPELPKLLSKGARFEISDLSVGMPEGQLKGNVLVTLPVEGTDNPFQLMQKITGQGKVMLSEAVLKHLMSDSAKALLQRQEALQAPAEPAVAEVAVPAPVQQIDDPAAITKLANEKLANMVQSGLLSLQGSDYVIEFKLAEGKLEINGKPFSSAMLTF